MKARDVARRVLEGRGPREEYEPITIQSERGRVDARQCAAEGSAAGAILVGGVGGGFDSPARGLYPRLCADLAAVGIETLRVRYRHPTHLEESVADVLAGIEHLRERGVARVGLVGHSLGGAVVVRAGVLSPRVATVVTLATQSYGTEDAADLAPRPILILHGSADRVLPDACSRDVYERASEPKELRILSGAGHGLDEAADAVDELVRTWLVERLAPAS